MNEKFDFIKKYFLIFMMYSIIGWLYEVFLEVVVYRWGFTNRGVLFGPYCPIYGFGALIFIFCFRKFIKNKNIVIGNKGITKFVKAICVFLGCMIVATIIELIASYILEFFTGHWLWETYVNYKYNFQGRIALSTSIRFGIGGLIFMYLIQPVLDKLISKVNSKKLNIIFFLVLIILIADIVYTFLLK